MKIILPFCIFLVLIGTSYWNLVHPPPETTNPHLTQTYNSPSKQVVMIIIDSLMDEPLQNLINQNKVPALQYLMKNGDYYPYMVTSYPTMSVVIDSTLLTGTYADQHKIPGLVWYDAEGKRFISYGSAPEEILKLGAKQVLHESLFHLNHQHLSPDVKTIHEEINGATASINTLVFRGSQKKTLQVPDVIHISGMINKRSTIDGPEHFAYGILSRIDQDNPYTQGWEAFGFNDRFSAQELKYLIQHRKLPAYTLAYFPDLDQEVHKNGIQTTKGIEKADQLLQEIFNSYPTWEEALNNTVWIVMGDSGQTGVLNDKKQALIDLRELLNDYIIHKISGPIMENDQIVLGLNERMSYVYLLDEQIQTHTVAKLLLTDERINQISWKEGDWVKVISPHHPESLVFKENGPLMDSYGKTWTVMGNGEILDIRADHHNIQFGDYPDALARLHSSFSSHSGRFLVLDAKPGYEFVGEGSPTHVGGGSHGSLHKQDSYFPMIVAGTELKPKHERMVDIKEWVLKILNVNEPPLR